MARDAQKLKKVAAEIRADFQVQTKVVVFDFATLSTLESVEELKAVLEEHLPEDMSILVNNVGCCQTGLLGRQTIWHAMRQVNININA